MAIEAGSIDTDVNPLVVGLQKDTGVVVCWPPMAKVCEITGKSTQIGGRYSNRTRATQFNPCGKVRRSPNIQKKRIFVPEIDKHVTVNVSTKGLRTITKNGAYKTLKAAGLI